MAHILAVDDSKAMRDMMKVVLEKNGHTVETAEDREEHVSDLHFRQWTTQ